jgi:hypothetical protein
MRQVSYLKLVIVCDTGGTGSVTSLNVRFSHLVLPTYRNKCSVDFESRIIYMINLCINDTRLGQLYLAAEFGDRPTATLLCN